MEEADSITACRLAIWDRYHEALDPLERAGRVRRPVIPAGCQHNAHLYYLLLRDLEERTAFIAAMKQAGIHCVFHYVPLHAAPPGLRAARAAGALPVTTDVADRLVRLPLWLWLEEHLMMLIDKINSALIGLISGSGEPCC